MRATKALSSWVAFTLSLLAVVAVATAIQTLAWRTNVRFDFTEAARLSLSPFTKSVLAEIREPLRVELFYRRGERTRSQDLLALMSEGTRKLSFELVDLDRNPARAKQHGVEHYDRAVISYQGRETAVPASDELTLAGGIQRILHEKPRIVYFTSGHRERSLAQGKDEDLGRLSQMLASEGYEVRPLHLLKDMAVPPDATAVVLAGPEVDYLQAELDAMDRYLSRGGSLLVMLDPTPLPRVEEWIGRLGIRLVDDVVIDRETRVYGSDGTNVVVPFYRDHVAVRSLDIPSVLGRARSVSLPSGGDDDRASGASIVARTAAESFAATPAERTKGGEVQLDPARDRAGPIGVIAVASLPTGGVAKASDGADKQGAGKVEEPATRSGRLVVVGDADFASDGFISLLGNKDLVLGLTGWLVAEAATGARPPDPQTKLGPVSPVYVSEAHSRTILISTAIVQPLAVLLIGAAVVLRRRRRR